MCGIGAILRTDGEPIPDEWLDALDARIAHRGPDGAGRFRDAVVSEDAEDDEPAIEVALVHRRLSIIDHDDGGQPMVSERGRSDDEDLVAVAFNGCIYNHRDLRRRLEEHGHVFVSDHSDTEVLVHGYREWGEDLPDHLEGMYAYLLWDRAAGTLIRSRDWFGEKPLYLCEAQLDGGAVTIAASDARAVADVRALACGDLDDTPSIAWCTGYLQLGYGWRGATGFGGDEEDATVSAVRPGLGARLGRIRRERQERGGAEPEPDALERLIEERLERAVERRLEADVPLGCFLSGGVDSSLVAHFAKRHEPGLRTFSVKMPDPRYDESAHAECVAEHLDTEHTTLAVAPEPARDIVDLVAILGQPFGDSSILPTFWVSRAAREHVKVALSGDGADELFFGYDRYAAARVLARGHSLLRLAPSGFAAHRHPKGALHKVGRLVDMAKDYRSIGILAMESLFTQRQLAELLGSPPESPPRRPSNSPPGADAMAALRMADVVNYLPGDLLTKVDTASMAVALEVRCPYLDRDLAAAALTCPPELLTPGRKRKGLLRAIARKHLPADVVDRPKMGFAVPIGEWFRTDYGGLKTLLLDHLTAREPFGPIDLERRAVRRLIEDHLERRADHGQRLFALLTLSIWAGTQ